jgi:hypothetical protein
MRRHWAIIRPSSTHPKPTRPMFLRLILLATLPLFATTNAPASDTCQPGPMFDRLAVQLAEREVDQRMEKLTAFIGQAVDAQPVDDLFPVVRQLLTDPLSLPEHLERIARAESPLHALMDHWQFGESVETTTPWQVKPLTIAPGQTTLEAILERMDRIGQHLDLALEGVEPALRFQVRQALPTILDRTSSGSELNESPGGQALADAIDKADLEQFRVIAALLAGLADPALADLLRHEFRDHPPAVPPDWLADHVSGDIVYAERHDLGAIIVGGPGNNRYSGPAALIIDLGGDNVYALPPGDPIRVIIDLEGNDQYFGFADGQTGGAVFGVSLLVDHGGDDLYTGGRVSQGSAVLGVGMLVDHGGNDRFIAQELAQGAALGGVGILLSRGGDNEYLAGKFAQGYGGALGAGLLHDKAGNDRYLSGLKHPSSYGEPGHFQSFSQGVGMGFRGSLAGGLGWLIDEAGDDHYQGGHFSQGIGYYLGMGLLLDSQGDDRYRGGRYSQGAAAHLGTGILIDLAGDDDYAGQVSASQGAAWDLALGMLIDCAGNDNHRANEFALGAAAQNAIGIFVGPEGDNQYQSGRDSFGHSGPADYHDSGKKAGNLGIFWGPDRPDDQSDSETPAGLMIGDHNCGQESP